MLNYQAEVHNMEDHKKLNGLCIPQVTYDKERRIIVPNSK
jgi:hypothetical protein